MAIVLVHAFLGVELVFCFVQGILFCSSNWGVSLAFSSSLASGQV